MRTADAVIAGGGITGFSIAFELLRRGSRRIVMLERETEVGRGSTARATGGIRHQFSTEANVRLTQLSYPFYVAFPDEMGQEIGFRAHGYLFVAADDRAWAGLRASTAVQQRLGVPTRLLSPAEAKEIFPPLAIEDVLGAAYCGLDGSASPTDALAGYRRRCHELGLEVRTDEPVTGIDVGKGVTAVRTTKDTYATEVVVDAAGPRVAEVAKLVGLDVPARPFNRQVFVVAPIPAMPTSAPLVIDLSSGWYIHQDAGGTILMGGTDKDSRPGIEPTVDWDAFDRVAEAATRRVPSLAPRMELRSAYSGIRTLTPDHHAILGRTPIDGFILASNCNGHGFMHAPAVGRLVAQEILDGEARDLDLAPLRLARFADDRAHAEALMF